MTHLNYQQLGNGNKHLLLIHGLFGSLENLNMVAKPLSSEYTVTSVDVRNHGSSFHENNMEYQALSSDIIELLDHLNIESTYILGHSMGGKIAMHTALHHSDRVEKLIVADIAPVTYPNHHQEIINGLQSIDLAQVTKRSDADKQLAPFVKELGVRQFLLRNLEVKDGIAVFKCNLDYIAQCYSQIMAGTTGEFSYTKPTLFIKGGNSDYITQEHRPIIAKYFPNSKAKIIQGAGHWLHAEKTVAFNKSVSDFLSD